MDTIAIQVPEGWLTMTREEYEAHLLPNNGTQPRWLSAKQMDAATGIPARRWTDMAKRGEIPYVPIGEKSFRFDLQVVYQHFDLPALTGPVSKLVYAALRGPRYQYGLKSPAVSVGVS